MPTKTSTLLVTINSTGRQAASCIRVASAVGWHIRGQVRKVEGLVAEELQGLPNVTLVEGELDDRGFVETLFNGASLAFINTTHWGDEVAIGKALVDSAKRAGVQHYVYSSMPDHSVFGHGWASLPLWAQKYEVEMYIRSVGIPSTFVYTGIYNNNFTTLPYPLFRLELQPDRSFVWQAPFHPDDKLPWLDAEHDVGPALLQIFKEGPGRWGGHRIPLTFEVLTPRETCEAFSRGLGHPVRYVRGPIKIMVPVPQGYREHLEALEKVLGDQGAPYFGPEMYYPNEAIELWEGNRGIEEYASEVFLEEERANGCTWMDGEEDGSEATEDAIDGRSTRPASVSGSTNGTGHGPGSDERANATGIDDMPEYRGSC